MLNLPSLSYVGGDFSCTYNSDLKSIQVNNLVAINGNIRIGSTCLKLGKLQFDGMPNLICVGGTSHDLSGCTEAFKARVQEAYNPLGCLP